MAHTNEIGVSFKILALILYTVSLSPVMQTLVTRPHGLRCSVETVLGSEEVTVASRRPPLLSLICRHSLRNASTLLAWTGNWCIGVPSGVPSGNVQRCNAPGLACITSSTSGPARLEEKGTLKERFTVGSTPVGGVMGGAPCGRRSDWADMSVCGLDIPKAGVIRSQPCRAWPVKLEILCMMREREDFLYSPSAQPGEERRSEGERGRKRKEKQEEKEGREGQPSGGSVVSWRIEW